MNMTDSIFAADGPGDGFRRTFKLSKKLSVTWIVAPRALICEWDPCLPRRLSGSEQRAYKRSRQEALDLLAEMTGGDVALLDPAGIATPAASGRTLH